MNIIEKREWCVGDGCGNWQVEVLRVVRELSRGDWRSLYFRLSLGDALAVDCVTGTGGMYVCTSFVTPRPTVGAAGL
jgi:hypothetical protein